MYLGRLLSHFASRVRLIKINTDQQCMVLWMPCDALLTEILYGRYKAIMYFTKPVELKTIQGTINNFIRNLFRYL